MSVRTVYRDIEFLRDRLGAPVEYDASRKGYSYSELSFQLPSVKLTEGEVVALFLAEQVLREYRGTPYEADIKTAFDKITAFLPAEVSLNLGGLESLYSFHKPVTSSQDIETFRTLIRAARELRRVEVRYQGRASAEPVERRLDPYHLTNVNGEWYLFAYCHKREAVRVFRPDRIARIDETGERFERPDDFDPADHLDGALSVHGGESVPKRVVLRFAPEVARFVTEKIWHPSQQHKHRRDGSLEVTFRLTSFVELERFILGWGRHCRVVSPKSLRERIRDEARCIVAAYDPVAAGRTK